MVAFLPRIVEPNPNPTPNKSHIDKGKSFVQEKSLLGNKVRFNRHNERVIDILR